MPPKSTKGSNKRPSKNSKKKTATLSSLSHESANSAQDSKGVVKKTRNKKSDSITAPIPKNNLATRSSSSILLSQKSANPNCNNIAGKNEKNVLKDGINILEIIQDDLVDSYWENDTRFQKEHTLNSNVDIVRSTKRAKTSDHTVIHDPHVNNKEDEDAVQIRDDSVFAISPDRKLILSDSDTQGTSKSLFGISWDTKKLSMAKGVNYFVHGSFNDMNEENQIGKTDSESDYPRLKVPNISKNKENLVSLDKISTGSDDLEISKRSDPDSELRAKFNSFLPNNLNTNFGYNFQNDTKKSGDGIGNITSNNMPPSTCPQKSLEKNSNINHKNLLNKEILFVKLPVNDTLKSQGEFTEIQKARRAKSDAPEFFSPTRSMESLPKKLMCSPDYLRRDVELNNRSNETGDPDAVKIQHSLIPVLRPDSITSPIESGNINNILEENSPSPLIKSRIGLRRTKSSKLLYNTKSETHAEILNLATKLFDSVENDNHKDLNLNGYCDTNQKESFNLLATHSSFSVNSQSSKKLNCDLKTQQKNLHNLKDIGLSKDYACNVINNSSSPTRSDKTTSEKPSSEISSNMDNASGYESFCSSKSNEVDSNRISEDFNNDNHIPSTSQLKTTSTCSKQNEKDTKECPDMNSSSDWDDDIDDDLIKEAFTSLSCSAKPQTLPEVNPRIPFESTSATKEDNSHFVNKTLQTSQLENLNSPYPVITPKKDNSAGNFEEDLEDDFDEETMKELESFFVSPNTVLNGSNNNHQSKLRSAIREKNDSNTLFQTIEDVPPENKDLFPSCFDVRNLPKTRGRVTTQSPPAIKSLLKNPDLFRYNVLSVTETETPDNFPQYDIIAIDQYERRTKIILRDQWTACPPAVNDIVHVITKPNQYQYEKPKNLKSIYTSNNFDRDEATKNPVKNPDRYYENIIVDREHNIFIVCPDVLVIATAVAQSFSCIRKVVLQSRVKLPDGRPSPPMVYGNMIHQLLQSCLMDSSFEKNYALKKVDELVNTNLETLFLCDINKETAVNYMKEKIPAILQWGLTFVGDTLNSNSKIHVHGESGYDNLAVRQVIDIEESIMAPTYGIKGTIDAVANVTTARLIKKGSNTTPVKRFVPIEIKTGRRMDASHFAQISLYNLLIDEKYNFFSGNIRGLLVYTETGETYQVPCIPNELRDVIIARNKLATSMKNKIQPLPEPTDHKDTYCTNCEYFDACVLYNNVIENQTAETFGDSFEESYQSLVNSIGPQERKFFMKWDMLLAKEEGEMEGHSKELWTMISSDRENLGRCFAHVKLQNLVSSGGYVYNFERFSSSDGPFKIEESSISIGESVFITDEETNAVIAKGVFYGGTSSQIQIYFSSPVISPWDIDTPLNKDLNLTHHPRVSVTTGSSLINLSKRKLRIDLDEFTSSLALARRNIIELVLQKNDSRLRNLILHDEAPSFKFKPSPYTIPGLKEGRVSFNSDQLKAVEKVMKSDHCTLILGMPGTGKTTTIAALIDTLVSLGKSVLLASYTNSAVDNILLKIKDSGYDILRIGRFSSVHRDVRKFLPGDIKDPEDINRFYMNPKVVASTCLGIRHWVFSKRHFDYCIIDEASQVTLPVCIGPLMLAKKFVLVGDHYQLSPLVINSEALEGGLDISLFKYLNDKYPQSVINLEHQYRMCKEIMVLSNSLIYEGRLKCGSDQAACQYLPIPWKNVIEAWKSENLFPKNDWLSWVLDENRKVLFLDTHNMPHAAETNKDDLLQNKTEAMLVYMIVEALCASGVSESNLGVISVYKSQLRLINSMLKHHKKVERLTTDQFQGKDKDCVIISLVRSNSQNQIGDLLQDWRRLNVAFTRAKSKLIIIGSRKTLETASALNAFLKLLDDNNWSYVLPPSADKSYNIPVPEKTSRSQPLCLSQHQEINHTHNNNHNIQINPESLTRSESETLARPHQRSAARFGPGIGAYIGRLGPVTLNTLDELGVEPQAKGLRQSKEKKFFGTNQNHF